MKNIDPTYLRKAETQGMNAGGTITAREIFSKLLGRLNHKSRF
jgi:hypothetical protein